MLKQCVCVCGLSEMLYKMSLLHSALNADGNSHVMIRAAAPSMSDAVLLQSSDRLTSLGPTVLPQSSIGGCSGGALDEASVETVLPTPVYGQRGVGAAAPMLPSQSGLAGINSRRTELLDASTSLAAPTHSASASVLGASALCAPAIASTPAIDSTLSASASVSAAPAASHVVASALSAPVSVLATSAMLTPASSYSTSLVSRLGDSGNGLSPSTVESYRFSGEVPVPIAALPALPAVAASNLHVGNSAYGKFAVSGSGTYHFKPYLQALGGVWDNSNRVWKMPEEKRAQLLGLISAARPQASAAVPISTATPEEGGDGGRTSIASRPAFLTMQRAGWQIPRINIAPPTTAALVDLSIPLQEEALHGIFPRYLLWHGCVAGWPPLRSVTLPCQLEHVLQQANRDAIQDSHCL